MPPASPPESRPQPARTANGLSLPVRHLWDGRPADPGEHVTLRLHRAQGGLRVDVDAPFHGDPPPAGPPGPTWGLWEHEVVELFLLGDDDRYLEVELSPHGHHLVLQLHGVRNVTARELPLDVALSRGPARWQATARLPDDLLPPGVTRANAYAIHGVGDARRYLAHAPVPGARPDDGPDFHRLHHFPRVRLP